jgi:hypothetical protein
VIFKKMKTLCDIAKENDTSVWGSKSVFVIILTLCC